MDLRSIQKPLKEKYRSDPNSSRITLKAQSDQTDSPIACSVEVGQKIVEAQAHSGVGGPGTAACSGTFCSARSPLVLNSRANSSRLRWAYRSSTFGSKLKARWI